MHTTYATVEYQVEDLTDFAILVDDGMTGKTTVEVDTYDVLRRLDPACRAEYQAFFGGKGAL